MADTARINLGGALAVVQKENRNGVDCYVLQSAAGGAAEVHPIDSPRGLELAELYPEITSLGEPESDPSGDAPPADDAEPGANGSEAPDDSPANRQSFA